MKFPRYGYTDMVRLQHRLVTEGLGLTRLHVVTGTSMGGMHTWMWGYLYPEFMDALVPLASNPVEIAGRNRVWRKLLVDAIVSDPTWKNGDYVEQPRGLASRAGFPAAGDERAAAVAEAVSDGDRGRRLARRAGGLAHAAAATPTTCSTTSAPPRITIPRAHLEKIIAPLLAINSADDFVNPPELPMMEALIEPGAARTLRPAADQRRDARARHALASRLVGSGAVRVSRGRAPVTLPVAALGLGLIAALAGGVQRAAPAADRLRVQVVRSYPHDRGAFTQGLVLHGGTLYESTGLVGQSTLREVELETGRVIRRIAVPPPLFAEGLALVGDRLIQLTWQNGRALVYDRRTFTRQAEMSYQGEGWGLCTAASS